MIRGTKEASGITPEEVLEMTGKRVGKLRKAPDDPETPAGSDQEQDQPLFAA